MNLRKRITDRPEAHTSALNDILFILLLFFLIISTLANPNVIKVSVPRLQSDTKAKQTVVVSIDSTQQFFVGTRKTMPDSLAAAIAAVASKSTDVDPTVVINADKKSYAESIATVIRAAKVNKLKTVMAVDGKTK